MKHFVLYDGAHPDIGLTGDHIPGFVPGSGSKPISKAPILFIHGMWEGAWVFRNWMEHAARCGHDVYAVDLRGHYKTDTCDIGKVSIEDYVRDALSVIRHIGKRPVIVGHSMGGLIAQIVAQRGHASKAVFVATVPSKEIKVRGPVIGEMIKHPSHLWNMLLGRPLVTKYRCALKLAFNNLNGEKRHLFERFVPESGTAAREMVFGGISVPSDMPCPTLVVSGSKDRMMVPGVQAKVRERYGSEFRQYPNGHMMMLERRWKAPIQGIIRFIAGTTQGQSAMT